MAIAVVVRCVERRVLATFAGIGPCAQAIHAHGQRFMRLRAQRSERHGRTHEACHDVGPGLDLVERHDGPGRQDLEQIAQGGRLFRWLRQAVVLVPGVGLPVGETPVHGADHRRLPGVVLALTAEAHQSIVRQLRQV